MARSAPGRVRRGAGSAATKAVRSSHCSSVKSIMFLAGGFAGLANGSAACEWFRTCKPSSPATLAAYKIVEVADFAAPTEAADNRQLVEPHAIVAEALFDLLIRNRFDQAGAE